MEKETIEHKEKTKLLVSISKRLRPAIRGLMIGMTAHVASGENAPGVLAIAGVLSTKSILTEFAKTNDKAFWANFFIETGIATLLITKYQDEVVATFSLASQLVTEIYQAVGAPEQLIEITEMFNKFPTEAILLLVFLIISHRSFTLLARKIARDTSKSQPQLDISE